MFDLSFSLMFLICLVRNGAGFPASCWIGPLKTLFMLLRSRINAKEQMIAAICPFTCVSTISYKLREIQELEGFLGVERREVNRNHIRTIARCVTFYLLCDLCLLYMRQQLKGEFSPEIRFSSWVTKEFTWDWKPESGGFTRAKPFVSLSLVLLISPLWSS